MFRHDAPREESGELRFVAGEEGINWAVVKFDRTSSREDRRNVEGTRIPACVCAQQAVFLYVGSKGSCTCWYKTGIGGEGEGEHREGASEREREISNWIGKSSSNQEGGRLGTATGNPLFCVITV